MVTDTGMEKEGRGFTSVSKALGGWNPARVRVNLASSAAMLEAAATEIASHYG
jgi:hypothetical protein